MAFDPFIILLERKVSQRFRLAVKYSRERVLFTLGRIVGTVPVSKHREVVSHHLGDVPLIAFFVLPRTGLELALHI